jgi:hypothetical protein
MFPPQTQQGLNLLLGAWLEDPADELVIEVPLRTEMKMQMRMEGNLALWPLKCL